MTTIPAVPGPRVRLTECPRDAMQGISAFIPTDDKVRYLNQLLRVGFPVLDFGSFVSPKAIPQLADTSEVLGRLDSSPTKLLAIVANARGVADACAQPRVDIIGYPLSVSEEFQQRNTKTTIDEALLFVAQSAEQSAAAGKTLLVYLSMAFGNSYGEPYDAEMVAALATKLHGYGIRHIALSDTIGVSDPDQICALFPAMRKHLPDVEFGMHLHSNPATAKQKIMAALRAGCRHLDGALLGLGGCPMAKDELTGNVDTLCIIEAAAQMELETHLKMAELQKAVAMAREPFATYH